MSSVSLIYRNITIYRLLMNALYGFGYKERFRRVTAQLAKTDSTSVLDLCFGDTLIAGYCKKNEIAWIGIDANSYFVNNASSLGYHAMQNDLSTMESFPKADCVIMVGSLYHFHNNIFSLLSKVMNAAGKVVFISEPVKNLSSRQDIIGYIARRSADAGKGDENFRYTEDTLLTMLKEQSIKLNFSYEICDRYKKDIVIKLVKNANR